jgi:predicted nicotinamide N-methyase
MIRLCTNTADGGATNTNTIQQKNVLELGAGLGLCGILAYYLQAANVVLTDVDTDALKFMRANVATNGGRLTVPLYIELLPWSNHNTIYLPATS